MPDQDQMPPAPRPARRGVLRGAAGLGAAGLAAGLLTVAKTETADAETPKTSAAHDEPLVVHVHDARTGVVDVYTGTRHVRVTDHTLAARLAQAAR